MYTWKWSNGELYYKSARFSKNENENENVFKDNYENDNGLNSQINAINQSLADEPFLNQDSEMLNITNSMFSRNQNLSGTRREDLDTKIADRQMIAQRGINPFLQTSYVNDVVARDMFLKPINTTFEREKSKENSKETS